MCVLSVIAQAAIDSAKRRFDIDISEEIKRIKADMDISIYGYPVFWKIIKKGFNDRYVNESLSCPMNDLYSLEIPKFRDTASTLPMSHFFNKFELSKNDIRRKSAKVEGLITEYSLSIYDALKTQKDDETGQYLLVRQDFDELIRDIQQINISHNYLGLFAWLVDRAFCISPAQRQNVNQLSSTINKNKSVLMKTLYGVNSQNLLQVFSKNI